MERDERNRLAALRSRRPWTESDAEFVLAMWHASGESLAAFARRYGLVTQRLSWWRKRLAPAPRALQASRRGGTIVPVEVTSIVRAAAPVVLDARGVRLSIDPEAVPPRWVAALVAALGEAAP